MRGCITKEAFHQPSLRSGELVFAAHFSGTRQNTATAPGFMVSMHAESCSGNLTCLGLFSTMRGVPNQEILDSR
jgi:hypothetical protein